MNMAEKVVNDEYYGKIDTKNIGGRSLYYPYTIAFFFCFCFCFYLKSKWSVELLN